MIDEKLLIEDLETWGGDVESLVEHIEKMPKVGEWISCSERLPSESGLYLATYECEDEITVDVMFFMGKQFYYPEDMIGSAVKSVEVIAWMELPPAYKGE